MNEFRIEKKCKINIVIVLEECYLLVDLLLNLEIL